MKKKLQVQTIQEARPYVLWRRVSTGEQGESGLGLSGQLTIAKLFMGKDPIEIFTDVFSGTKLRQCKGLWDAINLCKAHNYVLVIAKSDRCRNVSEALDILDAIGERNLIFCDLPTCDRFILTVMWAMWERQAIMGRINTKIALDERKKQIKKNGGFISKKGNFCDHFGHKKGEMTPGAVQNMNEGRINRTLEWKETSNLYTWVTIQLLKGRPRKAILDDAQELYEKNPSMYSTRAGVPLSKGTLSRWAREIIKKV
jgi:DNA invertase Pin-like site-specific DNA recombinase